MSMTHHAPDLRRVPCLGCDTLIAKQNCYRDTEHLHYSCCSWHAYHLWCVRPEAGRRVGFGECAECGRAIPIETALEMLRWREETYNLRLHGKSLETQKPHAYRFRVLKGTRDKDRILPERPIPLFEPQSEDGRLEANTYSHKRLELVHESCTSDVELEAWIPRLTTLEERVVFMDWLEEQRRDPLLHFMRLVGHRNPDDLTSEYILRDASFRVPNAIVRSLLA